MANTESLTRWFKKLAVGIAGGLILSILMAITGGFKNDSIGIIVLCVVSYAVYGIGFSFGRTITKNVWRKFVARGRSVSIWSAMTGNGFVGFMIAILVMILGLTVSCLAGFVICIIDLVMALTNKQLVSDKAEMKYGNIEYQSADAEDMVEDAVRANYLDHGTSDARTQQNSGNKGFNPDAYQVQKGAEKMRDKYGL